MDRFQKRDLNQFASVYLQHNVLEGIVLTPKAKLHIVRKMPSGKVTAPLCGIVDRPRLIYGLPIFGAGPRRRCQKCYDLAAEMSDAFRERLNPRPSNTGVKSETGAE